MVAASKDITCGTDNITVKKLKDTDACFSAENPPDSCYDVSSYNYDQTANVCVKDSLTGKNSVDCKNGLAYIACTDKVNTCIGDYNSRRKREWEGRRDAFNGPNGPPKLWDNRRAEWVNAKRNESGWRCDGCPQGWDEVETRGGCGKGNSERRCQKSQWLAEQEATNETNRERGTKPSFTEGEPDRKNNIVAAPVSCCNNVVNVVGGQIQNTNITQSCLIENSGSGGGGGTSGSKNANKYNSDGSVKKTEDDEYTGDDEEGGGKSKMFIILIVLIIFMLCSSVAGVLLLSGD